MACMYPPGRERLLIWTSVESTHRLSESADWRSSSDFETGIRECTGPCARHDAYMYVCVYTSEDIHTYKHRSEAILIVSVTLLINVHARAHNCTLDCLADIATSAPAGYALTTRRQHPTPPPRRAVTTTHGITALRSLSSRPLFIHTNISRHFHTWYTDTFSRYLFLISRYLLQSLTKPRTLTDRCVVTLHKSRPDPQDLSRP